MWARTLTAVLGGLACGVAVKCLVCEWKTRISPNGGFKYLLSLACYELVRQVHSQSALPRGQRIPSLDDIHSYWHAPADIMENQFREYRSRDCLRVCGHSGTKKSTKSTAFRSEWLDKSPQSRSRLSRFLDTVSVKKRMRFFPYLQCS